MYIYLSESGDFGINVKSATRQPYMLICALVVKDKKSRTAIAQAVSRATVDQRRSLKSEEKIAELKGRLISDEVRERLFKLVLRRQCKFEIYTIAIDKRSVDQTFTRHYTRRYAMLAHNTLFSILSHIGKRQRSVSLIAEKPSFVKQEADGDGRYPTKKARLEQVQSRRQEFRWQREYYSFVVRRFRDLLNKRGVELIPCLRHSEEDRCLQFANIIAHYTYEGLTMHNERRRLQQKLRALSDAKEIQKIAGKLRATSEKLTEWQETRELFVPYLHFLLAYRLYSRPISRPHRQPLPKKP